MNSKPSQIKSLGKELFLSVLIFSGIFIFTICSKPTYKIKYYKPIKHIQGFLDPATGDSIFSNHLGSIAQDSHKNFYICDAANHCILKLDSTLNLTKIIGRAGQGPGEFLYPQDIIIQNGLIYVNDSGNNRIEILDMEGSYQKSFHPFSPLSQTNFAVNSKGLIYTNTPGKDSLVTVYNQDGKELYSFGKKYNFPGLLEYNNNKALLAIDSDDNTYAAFIAIPKVKKYDKMGKLIWEKDTSEFPEVKAMLNRIKVAKKKRRNNPHLVYLLISDLHIGAGNNPYILCISPNPQYHIGGYGRNPCELDNSTGNLKTIYRLAGPNEKREDVIDRFIFFNNNKKLLCGNTEELILFAVR